MAVFGRLVVVLDEKAPREGTFAMAVDWACRLGLPILGISLLDRNSVPNAHGPPESSIMDVEKTCGDFCARFNIPWQLTRWRGPFTAGLRRLIQSADVLVSGHSVHQELKNNLFRETKGGSVPALLLCPEIFHPLTRILLVDQVAREEEDILRATAKLCGYFRAGLVVLTVARTELEARRRQFKARETLKRFDLVTDFDFLVGGDMRSVAASVARWRRCQLVVMAPGVPAHLETPRWWQWWRAGSRSWSTDLVESLALLTLPGSLIETAPVAKALPRRTLVPPPTRRGGHVVGWRFV
jgi:hypothetical protein